MDFALEFYNDMHSNPTHFIVGQGEHTKSFLIPRKMLSDSRVLLEKTKLKTPSDGSPVTVKLPHVPPAAFVRLYCYLFFSDIDVQEEYNKSDRLEDDGDSDMPEEDNNNDVLVEDADSHVPDDDADSDMEDPEQPREQYVHELCQTWVLGEKYSLLGLQNCAMFRLCRMLSGPCPGDGNCMTSNTLKYCYEHTEPGAKLRTLVADHVIRAYQCQPGTEVNPVDELSDYPAFAWDFTISQQSAGVFSPTKGFRMKYSEPYRYASRYAINFKSPKTVPAASCAA